MKSFFPNIILLALVIIFCGGLHAAQAQDQMQTWIPRCNENQGQGTQECEIFQRLLVRETGQRVAEFAVGFPDGRNQNARGVIVLPLGILLNEKTSLQIDDGAHFNFKMRYCTQNGCYAFLDLTPAIIEMMKKGNEAAFHFITLEGNAMSIDLSLVGFTKALDSAYQ